MCRCLEGDVASLQLLERYTGHLTLTAAQFLPVSAAQLTTYESTWQRRTRPRPRFFFRTAQCSQPRTTRARVECNSTRNSYEYCSTQCLSCPNLNIHCIKYKILIIGSRLLSNSECWFILQTGADILDRDRIGQN